VRKGEQILLIPKSDIYSTKQVRGFFDETKILELRDSLETHGQIQPIIVNKMDAKGHCIQKGERRWRAAMQSDKITHLECVVKSAGTVFQQLAENIFRDDLTPFEVGQAILEEKAKNPKLKDADIAQELAMSKGKMSAYINAAKCPKIIEDAYRDRKIGDVDTINSLRIAYELDPSRVKKMLKQGDVSREEAQRAVKAIKAKLKGDEGKVSLSKLSLPTMLVEAQGGAYYVDLKASEGDSLALMSIDGMQTTFSNVSDVSIKEVVSTLPK
jgi:ParB family chromosome partitioning protein